MANLKNPVKAIHAFCVECMGGNARDVVNCGSGPGSKYECPLYAFRQGKNPYRTKREVVMTEEAKEALKERLAKGREKKVTGE